MLGKDALHSQGREYLALVTLAFVEALDAAKNMEEMFRALECAANSLGFEGVSFTYIPPVILHNLESTSPVFIKSTSFSDGFISHYDEESLGEHDFVIKRVLESDFQPVHWWQEVERRRLTREEKYVVDVARQDYEIENAISIPTYKRDDGVAGITVTSNERKYYFDKLFDERIDVLKRLSRLFSDRMILNPQYQANFLKPFLANLSYTEKQVIILLGNGEPLKKAAKKLNISYGYACNVMEKLKAKFGNVTREQLFYLAGVMNFHNLEG